MPIYEYRCGSCGYQNDFLQKLSEPPLTDCPECGKATFVKQVTAAGFQLKGTGWYATDFKNNGKSKDSGAKGDTKGDTKDAPTSAKEGVKAAENAGAAGNDGGSKAEAPASSAGASAGT